MKQNLAGLELHYVIAELQFLVDGKLDKIYNPEKKELILQFHIPSKGKSMLRIVAGKFLYLTDYKQQFEEASGFCLYLRKHLLGTRLRKLEQKGSERIIEFEFEDSEGKRSLFVELFGKGNFILTKDNIIQSAEEQQKWADREVMPKQPYVYPKKELDFFTMTEEQFREFCKESKQESIVKTLAMELGLGRTYAEEACVMANVDKNETPAIGRKKLESLFKALQEFRHSNKSYIYKKENEVLEISPIHLQSLETSEVLEYNTYNEALDFYFTNLLKFDTEEKTSKKANAEKDRIIKIIDTQKLVVQNLKREEESNRQKAELIYTNYQFIGDILLQMRDAVKKFSAEEIKKRLKTQTLIKSYNEKEKAIVIDLK
ncbi:MAG: NFACT family protein [Candidatus Woesearchaeota archaeon]